MRLRLFGRRPVLYAPLDDRPNWSGPWPLARRTLFPARGVPVVYALIDRAGVVAYVGSTDHFRARMRAHVADDKRWRSWEAWRCESRPAAYFWEVEKTIELAPYLNRRVG